MNYKNWRYWSYNGEPFTYRSHWLDNWDLHVDYSLTADVDTSMPFRDACIFNAQVTRESINDDKIYLFFSGGKDSEIMVRSYLEAGIDFEVVIMKYMPGVVNSYDIQYAIDVCEQNNIKINYFEINPLEFFKSKECEDMVRYIGHPWPDVSMRAWVSEHFDGAVFFGDGEVVLDKDVPPWFVMETHKHLYADIPWVSVDEEAHWTFEKYLHKRGRNGMFNWFQYTPQLFWSMYHDPIIEDLAANKLYKLTFRSVKDAFYHHHWPEMVKRKKYHGWEWIGHGQMNWACHFATLLGDKAGLTYPWSDLNSQNFCQITSQNFDTMFDNWLCNK